VPRRKYTETRPRAEHEDVYFVQAELVGLIKIGSTFDLGKRLAGVYLASPVPLRTLGVIRGAGRATEKELHRRFEVDRAHGEWFHPVPELLAYISEHAERIDPAPVVIINSNVLAALHRWESGDSEPRVSEFVAWCRVLGVDPADALEAPKSEVLPR
jgi:hypothetical protein